MGETEAAPGEDVISQCDRGIRPFVRLPIYLATDGLWRAQLDPPGRLDVVHAVFLQLIHEAPQVPRNRFLRVIAPKEASGVVEALLEPCRA